MKANTLKRIIGTTALGTAAIVFGVTIFQSALDVKAADTLLGIETLITEVKERENPYTILEVVPTRDEAQMGYLVPDFEPVLSTWDDTEKRWKSWKEKIFDFETTEERQYYVNTTLKTALETYYTQNGFTDEQKPVLYETYKESANPAEGFTQLNSPNEEKRGYFETYTLAGAKRYELACSYAGKVGQATIDGTEIYYRVISEEIVDMNALAEEKKNSMLYSKSSDGVYTPRGTYSQMMRTMLFEETQDTVSKGDLDIEEEEKIEDETVSQGDNSTNEQEPPVDESVSDENNVKTEGSNPVAFASGIGLYAQNEEEPLYFVNFERVIDVTQKNLQLYVVSGILRNDNGAYQFHISTEGEPGKNYSLSSGTIYYKGGFTNQEWFHKYVLNMTEEEYNDFPVQVITLTSQEVSDLAQLPEFDMLCINAGDYTANDLSQDKIGQLFSQTTAEQKPCLIDGDIFIDAQKSTLVYQLCETFCQLATMKQDADKNFVVEQVYCYTGNLVNKDFGNATIYSNSTEQIPEGFEAVLEEIEIENLYRQSDTSGAFGMLSTDISQATAIRHVMNYARKRSGEVKKNIRVLEIEPARIDTPDLTVEEIKQWAPGVENVEIDVMTTAEFIGKVETLNDKYDLIYIGTSKQHLNTVTGVANQGVGSVAYNDKSMDGLIYTHTGDMRYSGMELAGQLDTEYVGNNRSNNVYYYNAARYSGNDITKEKMEALNSYLDGSYPVIVSDEFFETPVCVYQDHYYGGYSVNLEVGNYTMTQLGTLGVRNDDITSIKVKDGYRITYYWDDNFTGASLSKTQSIAYVGWDMGTADSDWNDMISSLKVEQVEGSQPQREIDADHIDNSSYMYEFAKKALDDNRSNFYARSDMSSDSGLFQFYLNRPKVTLANAWANGSKENDIYYISPEAGRYNLNYRFTIQNQGAASAATQYQCRFYIDVNADGKFSNTEELGDIAITQNGNSIEANQLTAGKEYTLSRMVPDGYKGVLPWKVEISQVNNSNIYCSMDGYTKLKGLEKETLNILQICRDQVAWPDWWGGLGEHLFSLEERIADKNDIYHILIYGGTYNGVTYKGISDEFEINVTFKKISEFESEFAANPNYLDQFNMLILGFSDAYGDFTGDATTGPMGAIAKFISSGKSVLFAHDTTSYFNYEKGKAGVINRETKVNETTNQHHNASTLNKYIRNLVGMDRYGIMALDSSGSILKSGKEINAGTGEFNTLLATGKDLAYKPKSGRTSTVAQTQGYTYSIINGKGRHSGNAEIQEYGTEMTGLENTWRNSYLNIKYGQVYYHDTEDQNAVGYRDYGQIPANYNGEVTNLLVTQVNKGQITEYPYKLAEEFQVSTTHGQYYQLDFSADDDNDNQSDLVVWYCLGGRLGNGVTKQDTIYSMSPNDVSNNYYIYNKGNVTYTGMGHGGNASTVDEAKLFINTMIASYSAGLKEPRLTIVEDGSIDANELSVEYRYNDEMNDLLYEESDTEFEKVYFKVRDDNFVKGTRNIALKCYHESNAANAEIISYLGENKTVEDFEPDVDVFVFAASTSTLVDRNNLTSGGTYYILVPKAMIRDYDRYSIYLEVQSTINSNNNVYTTGKTCKKLDFVKAELFDLT